MKRSFSLAILALCAMISFSSLHAADPDPYQNKIEKDDYALFNPSGNFSLQARLDAGESVEARNADAKGFVYKAQKPGMYSFLVDITEGTVTVYWGPTKETEISLITFDSYMSLGGEDMVNAEIQDQASRRGIYSVKNLLSNPGFESVSIYETHTGLDDQRGKADNWSVKEQYDVAGVCRTIEVMNNEGYANIRSVVEGSWIFMLHNQPTPLWQELNSLKPSTWYKVHYRQLAHKDTSSPVEYRHYISGDSAFLADENENMIATHTYMSAPQGFGNYVEVEYAFKTPASLPNKLFFAIKREEGECINHFDCMTMQEISESDIFNYGLESEAAEMTWQNGLQVPVGGSEELFEDWTDQYFVNPSFELTPINEVIAPNSNSSVGGNGPIYQPQGWTVNYSAVKQSPDMWDQGLVTSGESAYDQSKNPPKTSDTGFRPDDGEYFYYYRTRWTKNQDFEISQKLNDLPAGRYTLSVTAAADETSPATLKVSGATLKSATVTGSTMKTYMLDFNVVNSGNVTVSVFVEQLIDNDQARLAIDNFRLFYRGEPDFQGAIEDYYNIVENAIEELRAYEYSVPSGVYADWKRAEELTLIAHTEWTTEAWAAAAEMYQITLEGAIESSPLYFILYEKFENVNVEIANTRLSGSAAYERAAEVALYHLIPENPTLYYAKDLEQAIEDLQEARRAYYYTAFNDATTTVAKEVTYAIDYAPYFTKYGEDISSSANRIQGNWKTANNPATGNEYKLHTVNGKNCWNNWNNNFSYMDLYQDLTGLPEGMYSLAAFTATNGVPHDQHAYITSLGGTAKSPAATIQYVDPTDGKEPFDKHATWEYLKTGKVFLPEGSSLRIGFASTSGGGTSGWFCATGFELFYTKATPEEAKVALDIRVTEAETLLDTASVKIMGVEKAALNAAITAAKNASGDHIVAAFAPLNNAIENANTSILNYNSMYIVLVDAKVKHSESGYSQEAKDALNEVILTQEAKLAADDTEAADIPEIQKAIQRGIGAYLATNIEIPANVSPENPFELTYLLINSEIEEYELSEPTEDADKINKAPLTGWEVAKNSDKNSDAGQHYSGNVKNRYLDSWHATPGALKYTATQELYGIPNGTYRLVAMTRSSGEGAYLYAQNGDRVFVEEIGDFGGSEGPIWEAAEEGSAIKEANKGDGYGWQTSVLDHINVGDNSLILGVTNDPSVSKAKAFTGQWYSADEFRLFYVDTEFWYTGVNDVNAEEDKPLIVYAVNGYITVEGVEEFRVTTLSGALVPAGSQLAPGFYIVTAAGKSAKVVVR